MPLQHSKGELEMLKHRAEGLKVVINRNNLSTDEAEQELKEFKRLLETRERPLMQHLMRLLS